MELEEWKTLTKSACFITMVMEGFSEGPQLCHLEVSSDPTVPIRTVSPLNHSDILFVLMMIDHIPLAASYFSPVPLSPFPAPCEDGDLD